MTSTSFFSYSYFFKPRLPCPSDPFFKPTFIWYHRYATEPLLILYSYWGNSYPEFAKNGTEMQGDGLEVKIVEKDQFGESAIEYNVKCWLWVHFVIGGPLDLLKVTGDEHFLAHFLSDNYNIDNLIKDLECQLQNTSTNKFDGFECLCFQAITRLKYHFTGLFYLTHFSFIDQPLFSFSSSSSSSWKEENSFDFSQASPIKWARQKRIVSSAEILHNKP